MLGQDIVAAASCARTDVGAMQQLADTALAARDLCARLFEDAGLPPAFRIGIECGSAGGVRVGHEPRLFNLWGEAVRTASAMAASVMPGAIQVTETVHRMLTSDFLFRPRGSFYVPRVGAVQTFILASRL
jgi:adenylate cyclase